MIELKNVSFRYSGSDTDVGLKKINLSIPKGQVVLLCGESGCGKTTLTRILNGLIPHYHEGHLEGQIFLNGKNINGQSVQQTAKLVGSVFQNPRSQFFTVDTTSEIAFGCENMHWKAPDIAKRVQKVAKDFRVEPLLDRNLFKLSGGEKQKIACASVAAPNPEILVLDEPSSNLDISAMEDLASFVSEWKKAKKTVVIAEHRLRYLAKLADRVIYMRGGEIVLDIEINDFLALPPDKISEMGLRSIHPVDFKDTANNCKNWIDLKNAHFNRDKKTVLDIDILHIPKGSITAVLGNNGAGKTTLARCLCGLEKKSRGDLLIEKQHKKAKQRLACCYLVMQDVNHQLFTESVFDEVMISYDRRLSEQEAEKETSAILKSLNLLKLKDRHPQSLSGGEKQRVAIACAVASGKELVLYDEPTSGLDLRHMQEVSQTLKQMQARGTTQLVITHDPELVARCCDYAVFLENGRIVWSELISAESSEKLHNYFFAG